MKASRALPVFSLAFCVIYVACVYFNLALFTYLPKGRTFVLFVHTAPASQGPSMYWYGWIATSAISAFVIAAIASLVPQRIVPRAPVALVWIVPLGLIACVAYILRDWFTR